MASKSYAKGTIIETAGQPLTEFGLITEGVVKCRTGGVEITLRKGDVIGLADASFKEHSFTYYAKENTVVLPFSVKTKDPLRDLFSSNNDTSNGIARFFYTSAINQALGILMNYVQLRDDCADIFDYSAEYYEKYVDFCSANKISPRSLPQLESHKALRLDEDLDHWLIGYYASYREFPDDVRNILPAFPAYVSGLIYRAAEDIHKTLEICTELNSYREKEMALFMQESCIDLFDLYTGLFFRLPKESKDIVSLSKSIDEMIDFIESQSVVSTSLIEERVSSYESKKNGINSFSQTANESSNENASGLTYEVANSIDTILEYAEIPTEMGNYFKKLIVRYKKTTDKNSSDEDTRALRIELTKCFYEVYTAAFVSSITDDSVPVLLKMFFNFGYVDEELAGEENANYLFRIADSYNGDPTKGIYTAYEWLKAVYMMKKEPSRNEFDVDYLSYIHEKKIQKKITAEEEIQLSKDALKRLRYELENMFPLVNKLTFGRITTFCPVFSSHNVTKPLSSCLITPDVVESSFARILDVDFGAFNRETVYTNEKLSIPKEFISVKVLPDLILMPNIGTRGIMWQEIEGRKRTTPARFAVSSFHIEDIPTTFTRLVGEFRWEMCKRIQGPRWNDVTDRSLTSEYFDYIQFYKKNSDLSEDAKEKIKQGLVKAKNSFKEMFVRDYITWVVYEGTGAPRLNKISRAIMATYCPFPKELRKKMIINPLYKDLIERYEVKVAQKVHHIDNVIYKIKNAGAEVPQELLDTKNFIEGNTFG